MEGNSVLIALIEAEDSSVASCRDRDAPSFSSQLYDAHRTANNEQ